MPAIRKSCTAISAMMRCAVPSGRPTSTVAMVGAAVAHPDPHRFVAARGRLAGRGFAVVEIPGADRARRHRARSNRGDRMIDRAQVVLLFAVAQAGFRQPSGLVDAEIVDHVARPAAAVGGARQPLFGCEDAVAAMGGDMAAEIRLVAEQAEAVADLPLDPDRTAARGGPGGGGVAAARARAFAPRPAGSRSAGQGGNGRNNPGAHGVR